MLQDFTQALASLRRAADQGNAGAQHNLGVMYDFGEGVPQDFLEAHKWYNLAASRAAEVDAQKKHAESRDEVARKMTSAQITEAQRLAREWQAAFEKR